MPALFPAAAIRRHRGAEASVHPLRQSVRRLLGLGVLLTGLLGLGQATADEQPDQTPPTATAEAAPAAAPAPIDPWLAARQTAERVDELLAAHWQRSGVVPAETVDDLAWMRRLALDLAGRLPTAAEWAWLESQPAADRQNAAVRYWVEGPELPLHLGRHMDQWIQGPQAGDAAFVGWLQDALSAGRGWDALFSSLMVGPWDAEADRPATRFLGKRIKSLDSLTADSSRAFFGVDITCARCHDHPLVSDWTQLHYYGLASFFNRTYEVKKGGPLADKAEGEVTFELRGEGSRTAEPMFLSGQKVASVAKQNRRAELVRVALAERQLLSRTAVNRLWSWLLGRGLVEPVDQMHSGNPPSVPGVLELLADDLVQHQYDLKHLVRAIVLCRTYRADSRLPGGALPAAEHFAAYRLKPLPRSSLAVALVQATGAEANFAPEDLAARTEAYRQWEKQAAELLPGLDPAEGNYQASVQEALFLSNHAAVQALCKPEGQNLSARLLATTAPRARWQLLLSTTLGRAAVEDDLRALDDCWRQHPDDPSLAAAQAVWAVITSAEFRFNH